VSFKIIMTTSVTRPCFTTQYQTCKTKIKTDLFLSQTGLVLRPTVSDHITACPSPMLNLTAVGQTVWRSVGKTRPLASRPSGSLRTDTDRSGTYHFLINFPQKRWAFSDIATLAENHFFPNPRLFHCPTDGSPWNCVTALGFRNCAAKPTELT